MKASLALLLWRALVASALVVYTGAGLALARVTMHLARLAFRMRLPRVHCRECPLCRGEGYTSEARISNARHDWRGL